MPTYDDLRNYFAESRAMQDLAQEAWLNPLVRGITVSVRPLWAALYDMLDGVLEPWVADRVFEEVNRMFREPVGLHVYLSYLARDPFDYLKDISHGHRRRDLYRKLSTWEELARGHTDPIPPVLMTIVVAPVATPTVDNPKSPDEEHAADLRRLVTSRMPLARIEERLPARLVANAIQTSQAKSGTLGGVLVDPDGHLYGMTCQHVAAKGDRVAIDGGQGLGSVVQDTPRIALKQPPSDSAMLAMPSPYPGNGPDVNMLDFSLIELAPAPFKPSNVRGPATSLTQGQSVIVRGAKTNVRCRLGALAISYVFSDDAGFYGFRDAVELEPQSYLPLEGPLGRVFSHPPIQGDSGAWVVTDEDVPVWAGVFFGEDGKRGFCIRSKWAHAWAEGALGQKLTIWNGPSPSPTPPPGPAFAQPVSASVPAAVNVAIPTFKFRGQPPVSR